MVFMSKDSSNSQDEQSIKTYDSKGRLTSRRKKMSSEDAAKKRRTALRGMLMLSLVAAIAVCSTLAYTQLQSTEENVGIQTYQSIALSATSGAIAITERKLQGSEVMSTLMGELFPNAADWPFVSLEGYIPIAQKVASLSSSGTQAFMIVVDPADAPAYENHVKELYKLQKRPETAGYSDFGFGIWKRDGNETKTYPDGRIHDLDGTNTWGGTRDKMVVLTMHNSPGASSLLLNLYPLKSRGIHIESIFDCVDAHDNATTSPRCPVVTDMLTLVIKPGPAGLLFQPIFPKNDPNKFVGFATTSLHWDEVLTNVVPDYVNGLTCVIETATSAYTYEIKGGKPQLVGDGDLHDDAYTSYAQSVVLTGFETGSTSSAQYTLTVYPTEEMFQAFSTDSPLTVALGFAGVIAMVALLFLGYDYLMRREAEQRKAILEMKRKFVRFISHEIRTPLNTVCMGLELLQAELKAPKGLDGDAGVNQAAEEDISFWLNVTEDTNENAHVAVEILNDLLNYDKLETGTLELETEPVLIWDLVEKTVSQFGIQAVNRKVELKLDMERPSGETIPDVEGAESSDPYNVVGDSIRLSQVIRNVISNALKFTPEDGLIQVTTRYHPNGLPDAAPMLLEDEAIPSHDRAGSISISVKDSGVGLSRDQLARLFSEGVQFDANRLQHGGGSGLGLNIAKGLVEQHSGTIFADSEGLGHGTTFTIELPLYEFTEEELRKLEDDKDSETEPTAANSSVATRVDHTGGVAAAPLSRRVLVAEDSASSRKMLIRLLERAGHTCIPAANGKEAVECIKQDMNAESYDPGHTPIDTVLMDYEMPLLRGPDATKRIRDLGYKGIILGVTGNVLSEDVEFFMNHGANEVMPKPISLKKIQKYWKDHENGNVKPKPRASGNAIT